MRVLTFKCYVRRIGRGAAAGGTDAAAPGAGPAGGLREIPEVVGLALLHPTTGQDGEGGLSFTRLLGASRRAPVPSASVLRTLTPHLRSGWRGGLLLTRLLGASRRA